MIEAQVHPTTNKILDQLRSTRIEEVKRSVGETGTDILSGHFGHIEDVKAVELLWKIAAARSTVRFNTRFAAGNELTIQPPRILSELGYPPTSDLRMRQSTFISVREVEEAVIRGSLNVGTRKDPTT